MVFCNLKEFMAVQNRYQSIFETTLDGIIVINTRGIIEDINSAGYLPQLGLQKYLRKFNAYTPRILLIVGFILILRSAGLGIPYLSPTYDAAAQEMECCGG